MHIYIYHTPHLYMHSHIHTYIYSQRNIPHTFILLGAEKGPSICIKSCITPVSFGWETPFPETYHKGLTELCG